MKTFRYILYTCLLCSGVLMAQVDTLHNQYSFLKLQFNYIQNDSASLWGLYTKLDSLQRGLRKKPISVVHIGDSHIQADLFSGLIRRLSQLVFGSAGRGLVMPYKVGGTNGPWDYSSESLQHWLGVRNSVARTLPIGIAGFTIRCSTRVGQVRISLKPDGSEIQQSFTKAKILYNKYAVTAWPGYDQQPSEDWIAPTDSFLSVFSFAQPQNHLHLHLTSDSGMNELPMLFGVVLESGTPGIMYHTIGVNGAEFQDYNQSEYFLKQLPVLDPDLVLISLGTNDAYVKTFDGTAFLNEVSTLVEGIREVCPKSAFLLTAPADSYRYRKYKNYNMFKAKDILKLYALNEQIAFWNLYDIMGGYGSMYQWYLKGLGRNDLLHFSKAGYELQAKLFFKALMRSYNAYLDRHP